MGLYLMEDAEPKEWIARYSGDPLTRIECDQRKHSHYRMQVHKDLFLDGAALTHFEGRYINDARNTDHEVNARFAANYATETCCRTGNIWVRIYATKKINAGDEIFIDYGDDFWADLERDAPSNTPTSPTTNKTDTTSLWAAAAPTPELTPEHDSHQRTAPPTSSTHHNYNHDKENTEPTHTSTKAWTTQVPAPSSPMMLGHYNPTQHSHRPPTHPIQFPIPLSPITLGPSPNLNPFMIEHHSLQQLNTLDDTILLPITITHPDNPPLSLR